jgi:flagellar M-ring protein FliF
LALLGVAALVVMVGLRPAARALIELREPLASEGALALPGGGAIGADALDGRMEPSLIGGGGDEAAGLLEDFTGRRGNGLQKKLERLVEMDEVQAAAILKQWIRHGERV